jgi:trimeric autotransporter adhesin
MSTKTTFKRVALVTVAALGFGLLSSVAPATATVTTSTYTASLTPNTTSITRVGGTTTSSGAAIFKLVAKSEDGLSHAMFGLESITVSVVGVPAIDTKTVALNASDIAYAGVTATNEAAGTYTVSGGVAAVTNGGTLTMTNAMTAINSHDAADEASTNVNSTYVLAVYPTASAVDKGFYTLRLRLQNQNGFITDQTIKVQFVTSAADAGAVITITKSGSITSGAVLAQATDGSLSATIKDVNGGLIQADNGTPGAYDIGAPSLAATIYNSSTGALVDNLTASDNGVADATGAAADHVASTTATTAQAVDQDVLNMLDGNYGLTKSTALSALSTSTFNTVRVTYGSVAKTLALTVVNAASQTATPGVVVTAAGQVTALNPTVPLTTKSATIKVSGATAGASYQYKVVYTLVGAGDQSPLSGVWTTVYADAAGFITATVANGNPVSGATAVVSFSGFTANPTAQTITWKKSSATNISVDNGGAYVALKSTTVFTATITDAFGAPVSGVLLQPAFGATTNANYVKTLATVVTDASGKASYSLTDAAAVAAGVDAIGWTAVDGTSLTGTASATITYAATAPAVTTLTAYYNADPTTTSTAVVTAVPTGGIYVDGSSTKFPIQKARNTSVANAAAAGVDQLAVRINAGAIGAKVTATASAGAYILNSANFQVASSSKYSGTTGYTAAFVLGSNTTGANTVTFTSGTVTTTVAFWVSNTANDARFVTLTQAAAAGPVVAQVTDRYGISTSAGTLGNGQMTTVYTTDLSGKISVLPTGADSATITAIATNTSAQHADAAGYAGTAAVNADLKAGNSTATLSVTPVASASDVAQAAADAAAEATDAANAATDAANAAAEAADAATAAAQDAADAVAALSAQVADLISGLKAQLTALTNLVIKIQKKVKA